MIKKPIDWPVVLVLVISVLMLAYGMVALVSENRTDPVLISDTENQLDNDAWLALYEKKKAERKQEQQQGILRFFELGRED